MYINKIKFNNNKINKNLKIKIIIKLKLINIHISLKT